MLSYQLLHPQNVTVKIHDLLGRELFLQDVGYRVAGTHNERIDFSARRAGIYFIGIIGSDNEHASHASLSPDEGAQLVLPSR